MVTSPEKIKGSHDSAIENFEIPQYGRSMSWAVSYPKDNRKGFREFNDFGISFKAKPGALSNFVLVDCGDDIEEALITMDTSKEDISSAKYIKNITIPSALIEKRFGEALKQALLSGGDGQRES